MSTSLRRSAGSIATRKVIGWSLPSTLPTPAKPSSESARDTRSTRTVSTSSVSTRVPGPNTRAIEAASLAGGDARMGVVALVAEEGVELLGGRRSEESQQIVGPLNVATGDTAAHGLPVRAVDRLGIAHADVRDYGA